MNCSNGFSSRRKRSIIQLKAGGCTKHLKTGDLHRCVMNGFMGASNRPVVMLKNIHTEQICVVPTDKFWKEYDEKI